MKANEQSIDNCLKKYSEHHCVLIKKYRGLFRYVWVLDDNGILFRINVGKALYYGSQIGSKFTIGRMGRKLINIRRGFCKFSKLSFDQIEKQT